MKSVGKHRRRGRCGSWYASRTYSTYTTAVKHCCYNATDSCAVRFLLFFSIWAFQPIADVLRPQSHGIGRALLGMSPRTYSPRSTQIKNPRAFMVNWRDVIDGNDGTGRDGKTVVKNETVVPSRRQFYLLLSRVIPSRREILSRCPLRSRPVEKISPYRPVPCTNPTPTAPSRRQTSLYRPVPPSKPVPIVPSRRQNLSLPSRPAIHCRHSFTSRYREYY